MGAGAFLLGLTAVALAVFYQIVLKDLLFVIGITRQVQLIEEFPYECRRLRHELIEGCEDLWLDHEDRKLYAACGDLESRKFWCPATSGLNATARKGLDHFSILNIDEPGADGLFGLRALEITGDYKGATADKQLDLHGFDVESVNDSLLRFWMINHRPPVNSSNGELLDAFTHGANSTIEVFEHVRGSSSFKFIETIVHPVFDTPNSIAFTGDGGFLATNDHAKKVGWTRALGMFTGGGSISYHTPTNNTLIKPQDSSGFPASKLYYPNGIVRGKNNLFYLADSASGRIHVYRLFPAKPPSTQATLHQVDTIDVKLPLDNFSVDSEGTIWAAGFPKILSMLTAHRAGPDATTPEPATVLSIKMAGEGKGNKGSRQNYVVQKVLEDGDSKVLGMTTIAVHDAATGRIFTGGINSGHLVVCEKQK